MTERPSVPPVLLVLIAVVSVQFGGALAALLFPRIGVSGSLALRLGLSALLMCAFLRPRIRGRSRGDWATVGLFALTLAAMNASFYSSLGRIPIGVSVTIAFLGPLLLASATSRRPRDLIPVAAALAGVVLISDALLAPWAELDQLGLLYSGLTGLSWAAYIVLSARTGARFPGLDGMAITLALAALILVPFGVASAGTALLAPDMLLAGLGLALLSAIIPFSLELMALRHLSPGTFGVVVSLEPAAAALAGVVVLGQVLTGLQTLGLGLVVAASVLVLGRPARRVP